MSALHLVPDISPLMDAVLDATLLVVIMLVVLLLLRPPVLKIIKERNQAMDRVQLFSRISDQIADAVIVTDRNFRITYVNAAFEGLFGYSQAEILGASPEILNAGKRARKINTQILRRLSQGGRWSGVLLNRRQDGSTFHCELRIFPLLDESGQIIAYVGHQRDITRRRRMETELKLSEAKYRAYVNNSPIGIFVVDSSWKYLEVNDAGCRMTGYTREQILTKSVADLFPHKDYDTGLTKFKELLSVGKIASEIVLEHKNGAKIWVLINAVKLESDRFIGFCEDITKRIRVEEALRESESLYRALFENAPIPIGLTTFDGKRIAVNSQLAKLYGYSREEMFEINASEHYADPEARETFIKQIRNQTGIIRRVAQTKDRQGKIFSSRIVSVPLKIGSEDVLLTMSEDVTARLAAESKIQHSLAEKTILLQEIHHRVANNMQLTSSLLNLQSRTIKGKAANKAFQEARHRIDIMALIYQQLYQNESLSHIDLRSHFRSLVSHLQSSFGSEAATIEITVSVEDVPFTLNTIIPISLIITELVTNAIKYAFRGRAKGKIWIDLSALDSGQYNLIIGDDGIGLPGDITLDDSETLGLRLTHLLARQLGGWLDVSRIPGTEFKITWAEKRLVEA